MTFHKPSVFTSQSKNIIMALSALEIRGAAARRIAQTVWPAATSTYAADGAEIHDAATEQVLGASTACESPVEVAWINAARATLGKDGEC